MAASTITALEFMLKRYFAPRMESLTLRDNTLLDKIKRDPNHGGSYKEVPVLGTGPQGITSTSFSTAQTNAGNSVGYKFLLDTADYFMVIPFDNKALESSQGAAKAYMTLKKQEIEEGLNQFGQLLSAHLFGTGGGAIGQGDSTNPADTSPTITLANPGDIVNFEKGMRIVSSTADGSAAANSLTDGGAVLTVATVNYNAGSFTCTGTITGLGASAYYFREATFAGNVNINAIMKGLQAWGPATTTSSTSFFGVDRSVNTRLFMGVDTAADGTVADRLQSLAVHQQSRYESTTDIGYVHPTQWLGLARELAGQSFRPIDVKNYKGDYGYKGLELITASGVIPIMADKHCPLSVGWLFKTANMQLVSINQLVHNMNVGDGLEMLRQATSAGYEARYVSYPQLEINKPCAHGRVTLLTA